MHRRASVKKSGSQRPVVVVADPTSNLQGCGYGTVVIDIGSLWTRIGVSGDTAVRCVLETPLQLRSLIHKARDAEGLAALLFPFLHQCCEQSGELLGTSKNVVLLTNAYSNPVFLDTVSRWLRAVVSSATSVLVMNAQLAALHSFGVQHGIVVDIGYFSTRVVPIVGGVVIYEAIIVASCGFKRCIEWLRRQLLADHKAVFDSKRLDASLLTDTLLTDFIQAYGVVAPPDGNAFASLDQLEYPLPVKTVVLFGKPCLALETLMSTEVDGDDEVATIPSCIWQSLKGCNGATQRNHIHSLCLVGGGSVLKNAVPRIAIEVQRRLQEWNAASGRSLWRGFDVAYKKPITAALVANVIGGMAMTMS